MSGAYYVVKNKSNVVKNKTVFKYFRFVQFALKVLHRSFITQRYDLRCDVTTSGSDARLEYSDGWTMQDQKLPFLICLLVLLL